MYKHKDCVGISVLWRLCFSFCQEGNKSTLFPVLTFCSLCWDILKTGYFWGLSHPCMDFFHPVVCSYWDAMLKTGSLTLQSSSSALKCAFCNHSSFVTCFCQWSVRYRIAWDGFFCFCFSWNIIRGAEFWVYRGLQNCAGLCHTAKHPPAPCSLPSAAVGERTRREKNTNKDKKRRCKDRHSPFPTSRSLNSSSFGNIPPVLLLSMMLDGRELPWISVGQLCPLCPLAASCPPQPTCWGDRLRTEIWKLWALFGNS